MKETQQRDVLDLGPEGSVTLKSRANAALTPLDYDAATEVAKRWLKTRAQLTRALFAYYAATRVGCTESGPVIDSEEFVLSHISVKGLWVCSRSSESARYVSLYGECSWEEEHGLEIHLKNGREILYVGQFDGSAIRDPPDENDALNFALPIAQEKAISDLDDLKIEEARQDWNVEDTNSQVESPQLSRRPWWRFW